MASGVSPDVATESEKRPPRPAPKLVRAGLAVDRGFTRLAGLAMRPFGGVLQLWRRSIQARVVIGTLALSAILSILAGWVLLSRVSDGLLESKRQAAISQTVAGVD